jgi:uncharacterized membrane protein YtjA (UPF0391 family)
LLFPKARYQAPGFQAAQYWNFLASGLLSVTFEGDFHMLKWALIFAVIALIAGLLGFTGVAGTSMAIAKTLFFIFLVIFLVLLVAGLVIGRKVTGN